MMGRLILLGIVLVLEMSVTSCAVAASNNHWPKVEGFQESFHFNDVDKAGLSLIIKSVTNKPLYALTCHSGSFNDDSEFDYSGLIACRLSSLYSKEVVSTLLTETMKQTSDWGNRGRFLVKHLLPGCAKYPNWGSKRTFYLRSMELVLSIDDESFAQSSDGKELLKSYSLNVIVRPDPSAVTSIAKATDVPEPSWFYGSEPCPNESQGQ